MAPKKVRNGFYYFMMELRRERGLQMSNVALTEYASPFWNELTAEDKESYNRMAKEMKSKGSATENERKYTSLGVSFAAIESNERERQEKENLMKATIKNTVNDSSDEALRRKRFHFCHVNHYFKTDEGIFAPCEIAIVEFSLEDGITDILHFIVEPDNIPLGVRSEARDWANKTHGIPLRVAPDNPIDREQNYLFIYSGIIGFLKKNMGIVQGAMILPPLYTMPDSLNHNTSLSAVECSLKTFSRAAHEDRNLFRVYPLPELFFQLREKWKDASAPAPTKSILENEVEKDVFSSAVDLGCKYHEEKDLSLHCSLAIVKRWVFTVCDHICFSAGVSMVQGKHVPFDTVIPWSTQRLETIDNRNCTHKKPTKSPPQVVDDASQRQAMRMREKEEVEEELAEAERMRPPTALTGEISGLSITDEDFPPIGGGGRGALLRKVPLGVWPISGRGKLVKK